MMGNSCFGVTAEVILGKLGQRSCMRHHDLGTVLQGEGAYALLTGLSGVRVTVSPALVLDTQLLSRVQLPRCVLVCVVNSAFAQTEPLESGVLGW